jgi:CheY-like chemotaxis protein/signal transduction histidine kinase
MNPLYIFLHRLTKKLELQADLDVVNKIIVVYFVNITGIALNLFYGIFALIAHDYTLASVLFTAVAALSLTLALLHFGKQQTLSRILIAVISAAGFIYLLHTGASHQTGHLWVLLYPVFAIPLFGLSRGNVVSFLFFLVLIVLLSFQKTFRFEQLYSTGFSLRLMGAYAGVHLLTYLNEFLKLHNYQVMVRIIIESKNETRQKDDFLSKLSHQIRTPLNNLTVVSNLINRSKLDPENSDLFDTIMASTINLINVVNNIVKVSEVKIEKEMSSQVNFDLYSSVDNTLKLFRDQHKDRLEINLHLARAIKTTYIGDPIRIKQIFLNIIENIIKANPTGSLSIDIGIDIPEDRESESVLNFAVHCPQLMLEADDYGNYYSRPGIELIKSGAYQPDDYFIDFTIAKKIIESYGGELHINSVNDQTAVSFGFTLKKGSSGLQKAETEKDSATIPQAKQQVALKNANILLVEDNAINQKIIILSLRNVVKNIDIAHNGKDALDKFGTSKYDLILMDIQMPVINGIVATKKIRELEASSNTQTPIIAITANALSGDKETCLAAGMNDYISKPFQVDVLVNKMKALLEN